MLSSRIMTCITLQWSKAGCFFLTHIFKMTIYSCTQIRLIYCKFDVLLKCDCSGIKNPLKMKINTLNGDKLKTYVSFLPCVINGGFPTRVQSSRVSSINCQQLCLQNLTCFSCYVEWSVSFFLISHQTQFQLLNRAILNIVGYFSFFLLVLQGGRSWPVLLRTGV